MWIMLITLLTTPYKSLRRVSYQQPRHTSYVNYCQPQLSSFVQLAQNVSFFVHEIEVYRFLTYFINTLYQLYQLIFLSCFLPYIFNAIFLGTKKRTTYGNPNVVLGNSRLSYILLAENSYSLYRSSVVI